MHRPTEPVAAAPRRAETLERRLPVTITILLVVTVAVFGVLAFGEVRKTSVSATTSQLRTVTSQVVQSLARGVAARSDAVSRLAREPLVTAAAQHPTQSTANVTAMLKRRRVPADTLSLVSQWLIDRTGRRRTLLGPTAADSLTVEMTDAVDEPAKPLPVAASALDSALARSRRNNAPALSEFFEVDGEVRFWIVATIDSANVPMGAFVEERRIRGAQTADEQIRAITGQDFKLYLTDQTGRLWFGASGALEPVRFDLRTVTDSFRLDASDGETLFGRQAEIAETPWKAIVVASATSVYARSMVFLRRMMLTGAFLLTIGALGAWWISRQVTQPLHSLAEAAQAIAAGDFTRREVAVRDDELGMLATAFNRMAQRVGDSHRLLETRIRESELLAATLEQRNEELQSAQLLATEARVASDAARAEAQRASAAKSEFLAMMSHELRTPLSAIAGYAEILQLGLRGPLNDAARNDIARIQANQAHLLRIINDILDLAQVESGSLVVSSRAVSLREILGELDAIVRPFIDEKDLQYIVADDAMPVQVTADPERLTQVLVNLVANAVRFTDPGGSVRICAKAARDRVQICVIDSGVGIAPEQQDRVFQPFVQVDAGSSRRAQGTGLGLAISRQLVEAMGGTLTLTSERGVGTTFVVDLAEANAWAAPHQASVSDGGSDASRDAGNIVE